MLLLPFELWICLVLATGLAMILAFKFAGSLQQRCVLVTHSNSGWTFQSRQPVECVSGTLVQAGYRSAWLIILVIQTDDTTLHRVAVWQDQVSSRQFSYLHQQLAFAAAPPVRRRPALWLIDCIGMQPPKHWQQSTRENTTLRKQARSQSENTLD